MENDSLRQQQVSSQKSDSIYRGGLVSRIRAHLRAAAAKQLAGDAQGEAAARDRAETLLRELEGHVASRFAQIASWYFRRAEGEWEECILEMYGTLRDCVFDLSPQHEKFETLFNTCLMRRCINGVRQVCRRNGYGWENNRVIRPDHLRLESPLPGENPEGETHLDVLADARLNSRNMADNEFAEAFIDEGVAEALESLPDKLKSVTKLFYDGLSYEDIGQQLGVSSKTASKWHGEAYEHVRSRLQ